MNRKLTIEAVLKSMLRDPITNESICTQITNILMYDFSTEIDEQEALKLQLKVITPFIKTNIPYWPKFSGDLRFFIPSSSPSLSPKEFWNYIFDTDKDFWIGTQGELRRSALRFLIARAKELKV